jgi:peptide/nickel transport system permease protein
MAVTSSNDAAMLPHRRVWLVDFARAQPMGAIAAVAVVGMVLAGLFAPYVAPYNPVANDFSAMLSPPTWAHPFGTDNFGRDILSRIIYGARTAMIIGFAASLVGCTVGALIGIASAYYGGRTDLLIQRLMDILLSFPIIVLAVVTLAMLGRRLILGIDANLVVALALPIVPKVARVIRSTALTIAAMPYIDAARAAGYSDLRIILRHIAPNVAAPFLILVTAFIAQAILLEASLSFLGLGVVEPTAAWGLMLSGNAADFFREAPWLIIFPGLAISIAVFAFNFLGDALRDWLDPKFRS